MKLGTIAVDGTKLRANASKHKAMSYQRMRAAEVALKARIDALLRRAAQADKAEANEPELDIPAEIERRKERLAVIAAAKLRLDPGGQVKLLHSWPPKLLQAGRG